MMSRLKLQRIHLFCSQMCSGSPQVAEGSDHVASVDQGCGTCCRTGGHPSLALAYL